MSGVQQETKQALEKKKQVYKTKYKKQKNKQKENNNTFSCSHAH